MTTNKEERTILNINVNKPRNIQPIQKQNEEFQNLCRHNCWKRIGEELQPWPVLIGKENSLSYEPCLPLVNWGDVHWLLFHNARSKVDLCAVGIEAFFAATFRVDQFEHQRCWVCISSCIRIWNFNYYQTIEQQNKTTKLMRLKKWINKKLTNYPILKL